MRLLLVPLLLGLLGPAHAQQAPTADRLSWSELPPLPDTPGFGGPFVGVHRGALVVAGGANFPDAVPWEGGTKAWYSGILVLEAGEGTWRDAGHLDGPRAYGAAVSLPQGIAILGGSDSERHHAECWLLSWDPASRNLRRTPLPSLPVATAFPAAAALGEVIYLAAGSDGTNPTALTHAFWALDLSRPEGERQWEERPAWPGPARHKAVAAVQSGGGAASYFHLFSGEIPSRGALVECCAVGANAHIVEGQDHKEAQHQYDNTRRSERRDILIGRKQHYGPPASPLCIPRNPPDGKIHEGDETNSQHIGHHHIYQLEAGKEQW